MGILDGEEEINLVGDEDSIWRLLTEHRTNKAWPNLEQMMTISNGYWTIVGEQTVHFDGGSD
ncbi:hypothetical protein TIFTF001_038992 [Ficus carica]|uniref:Uncharacterized protein n=1 Tax=Ficus carica TaxID=3494 RepID=A0AA88ED96_FICCA|nr:hypothetical protein TIFTF001_038992 [Ficus carica]